MPCHQKGQVGAMPLSSYKEAKAYASMISYVTENKLMPPWKADGNFSKIKNFHPLVTKEIELLKQWVKAGMPEGKPGEIKSEDELITPNTLFETNAIFAMEQSFQLKNDYRTTQQVFVIPAKNKGNKFIAAIEFIPGNASLIKSCSISIDTSQTAAGFDGNDEKYGYYAPSSIGFVPYQFNFFQWIPGVAKGWHQLPGKVALPAGSRLIMAINYTAVAADEHDSSYVKIHYAVSGKDSVVMQAGVLFDTTHISNGRFEIKSGEKRKFLAERKTDTAITIYGLMPLGQFSLSSWEIYAINANTGERHNLLKIPFWDAHWKRKYELQSPVHLPAGSSIFGVAYYNNGDDNPNLIITPPKDIRYGEGHRDELFLVQYDYSYE